jgi:type I restriction enzyme, S subunit
MSEVNKIPKDWKYVKVGEYVISVKGKKPKKISNVKTKKCPIPYVNIKAFEKKIIDEYTDGVGCALCEEGDFLMVWDGSRSGYVGKAIKGALGSTLVKLNFPDIDNNYAYYFLQSKYIEINTRAKGVGIPHVDPNILWNYDLLIPPLPTQLAIVSKIEELFSELDKGIENLKIAQQQLKTYRQSVLKWAFEGKLSESGFTRSEDKQDKMSIKKSSKSLNPENPDSDNLPKGWKMVKIGEVCESIVPNRDKPKTFTGGIKWITTPNLSSNSIRIDYESVDLGLTENEVNEYNARLIPVGSVIMTCVGNFGLSAIVEKPIVINQQLHAFITNELIFSKYLAYCIQFNKHYFESKSTSTTIQYLNKTNCNSMPFPHPPIQEQHLIVSAIESRLSVADKLEESITNSLQQAEALRQSILKKAFEGKLI